MTGGGLVRSEVTGATAWAALSVAVATSFVAGPMIAATAPTAPAAVACWRLALAAAALVPFGMRGAAGGMLRAGSTRWWALGAGLALAAHFYFWIQALRLTAIAPAVTLVNASPLALVALEALLLRQPVSPSRWPGIALGLAGVLLLGAGDWTLSARAVEGDAFALAGAVAYALYLVAGRHLRRTMGALEYNLTVFTFAAVVLAATAGLTRAPLTGYSGRVWWLLLGLAAMPTLLGHALANYSLARLSATTVGLAYLLEPAGGTAVGYLWLGQVPTPVEIAGTVVTVAGLALYLGAGLYADGRAVRPGCASG